MKEAIAIDSDVMAEYAAVREGAGLLSSLVDTDGVVELEEQVTRVEPGQIVDCLTYVALL